MRVLVIGGTGFIGPYVIHGLAQSGHEVSVYHRGIHEPDLPPEVHHVHSDAAGIPVLSFPDDLRRPSPDVVLHMFPIGERDAQDLVMDSTRIRTELGYREPVSLEEGFSRSLPWYSR
ncbi:MAG: NAD-dependent epimerase/dehydratase family protein [Acidobacteria bacterium]|nr:NAD-dependent epimerase/dehydratase family protein [Acidobacteriota bacterium]